MNSSYIVEGNTGIVALVIEVAIYFNLSVLSSHMENRISIFSYFGSESEFLLIEDFL